MQFYLPVIFMGSGPLIDTYHHPSLSFPSILKRFTSPTCHLLKEIKEETSNRNKIRNLLVLLARCAALAALVFAFAQPLIKQGSVANARHHAVQLIIDNSFSMDATRDEIPLLRLAKDKALEIISAHNESDIYLILTHDLASKHQEITLTKRQQFHLLSRLTILQR